MPVLNLKDTHKPVRDYYAALRKTRTQLSLIHEGAVAPHFAMLLRACASRVGWTLAEQHAIPRKGQHPLRADGVLLDDFKLRHGVWEAKDSDDDLAVEVRKKLALGYPRDNILFQAPGRAILYQDGRLVMDEDISRPEALVEVLKQFFGYEPPAFEQWDRAVEEFKERVPELAQSLLALIEAEHKANKRFREALEGFKELVRQSINPNISEQAVEEMLIQHLLTERIFRTVFNNSDFGQRNIIAREIEKVIDALTSRHFSRHDFLGNLDRFYGAIETTAATIGDYSEKQAFLNTVYEKFFQGFSVKVADTHGIVYTPQPIVEFMVRSVDDILRREFGKAEGLASEGVAILDPFVGTGNFILRVMRQMPKSKLPQKYQEELFCNEVMLLPYYIASMNIEHEYYELTRQYEPFEGIALVDTFELAEGRQLPLFVKENTRRVQRQKDAPIFVIIGNPPYNAHQVNQNDNSQNRKYPVLDERVGETYAAASRQTNKVALSDVYVKAFRWASDRIGDEGIVALISNNGFLDGLAFDGMRQHLSQDFSKIYHLDLKGNARTSGERRKREAGNVFNDQIRVGVGITFLLKQPRIDGPTQIYVSHVDDYLRSEEKQEFLNQAEDWQGIDWQLIEPNRNYAWLTEGLQSEFKDFLPIGTKDAKAGDGNAIFENYGRGVSTSRNAWAYNFNVDVLTQNIQRTIEAYNSYVYRRQALANKSRIDEFISYDSTEISWSRDLKLDLKRENTAQFEASKIRKTLFRPFTRQYLFFDRIMNEEVYQFPSFFPTREVENTVICVTDKGTEKPFMTLATDQIADLHSAGVGWATTQCFPFYTYDEDGRNRRENITDWALAQFREMYAGEDGSPTAPPTDLSKWDIFHYVYALLHHPEYRERYAANLRRELPRVPFVRPEDFWELVTAGKRLAEIHVHYEKQAQYPLKWHENPDLPLDFRVEKMRLSRDKSSLKYNEFLTLEGIPPQVFEYKLGNRSALEWVIDQYRVTTDKRSGIMNDPNRPEDERYILRLIGQVITVSLETVEIVGGLRPLQMMEVEEVVVA